MVSATATEMQNNFEKYLNMVLNGSEVIVTKGDYTLEQERDAILKGKYEVTD